MMGERGCGLGVAARRALVGYEGQAGHPIFHTFLYDQQSRVSHRLMRG